MSHRRNRARRRALGFAGAGLVLLVLGGVLLASHTLPLEPRPCLEVFVAARDGDAHTLDGLLRSGADANSGIGDPSCRGQVGGVRALLARLMARLRAKRGAPALQVAADSGHSEVARLLLRYGARADAPDETGATPLMAAAGGDHEAMVRLLLASGADPCHRDDAGETPLHEAARHGSAGVVRTLCRAGANPNVTDGLGWTPLAAAVFNWNYGTARELLARGADPDLAGPEGLSAAVVAEGVRDGDPRFVPLMGAARRSGERLGRAGTRSQRTMR